MFQNKIYKVIMPFKCMWYLKRLCKICSLQLLSPAKIKELRGKLLQWQMMHPPDDASTWPISNENNSQGASLASPPRIFQTPSLNTPVSTLCHSAERKKNPSHYLNTRLQPMGGTHGTNKSDSWTWIDSNFEFTSRFEDCSHIMKSKKYIFENGSDW